MSRHIACFEVPSLEIALARLRDRSLVDRPVAIAPAGMRACLTEVSDEARQDGLLPGMPVAVARRLCPSARVLPPDPYAVQQADRAIWSVVARYAPAWEPFLPGHVFLDLTGTTRLFGAVSETAAKIERSVVAESGLTGLAGVGSSKLVARVASDLVPPSEVYEVWPGAERPFLAPLPIQMLPGVRTMHDRAVPRLLDDLNLQTVGDLAATPLRDLESAFGRWGPLLHQWAQGIDPTPVRPRAQQPRLEASMTLAADEIDDARIRYRLRELLDDLCRSLRRDQRVCRGLTLTLRHSDDVTATRSLPLPAPTCWAHELLPALETLYARAFTRRVRLRRLAVALERLVPAVHQLTLFPDDTPARRHTERAQRLALALDRVHARHGPQAIARGVC
ncbi:MAG TPA: hypothetical protein VFA38_07815 [Nitrospirales bacterium]|nr:hypothetical protein [Nitrospirales bacterium]